MHANAPLEVLIVGDNCINHPLGAKRRRDFFPLRFAQTPKIEYYYSKKFSNNKYSLPLEPKKYSKIDYYYSVKSGFTRTIFRYGKC